MNDAKEKHQQAPQVEARLSGGSQQLRVPHEEGAKATGRGILVSKRLSRRNSTSSCCRVEVL